MPLKLQLPLASLQCGHLLKSITNSKLLKQGKQIHAHVLTSGVLIKNIYLSTKLCAMYAINGAIADARFLFDEIPAKKNSFLWNFMIRGYATSGHSLHSLFMHKNMSKFGFKGDNFSYPFVIMACGDLLNTDIGKKIHSEVIAGGYQMNIYVNNSLLSMYAKFGDMTFAQTLFDNMSDRDITSWNTLISGYVKNDDCLKAMSVFSLVSKGEEELDHQTLVSVLPALANLAALKQAKEVHAYILHRNLEKNKFLTNSLIDVYLKCNFIRGSKKLFEEMHDKDIVSWNILISGLAHRGHAFESLNLFQQMQKKGFITDKATLISVLGACDMVSALQLGTIIHSYIIIKGLDKEIDIGTSLIDMYAKCGRIDLSSKVFEEMPSKNLISWSAMISAYGLHGKGKEAVKCFNEMKMDKFKPDKVTFTSVLSACSHSGLVDEAKDIFHNIAKESNIKPSIEHYVCMVDLLGRNGFLEEAYRLIMSMEVEPNIDVWAALLFACRTHHNVELAEIAFNRACELEKQSVGVYVSLSNVYAKEKRWGDVEKVRALVRGIGLRKTPGCANVH